MNPSQHVDPVLVADLVVAVLAGVGVLAAFGAGARAGHRVTGQVREVTRIGGNLTRALAAGGVIVGAQWAVVASTTDPARYERQMRAAEAAGDQEALRYWQEADVAEKHRRHERVTDWMAAPGQWVRAGVVGLGGLSVFLLVLGGILAVSSGDVAAVTAPAVAVVDAVAFGVWFLLAYGVFLLAGGTVAGVVWLYWQGRAHAEMPRWLSVPTVVECDVMDGLPDEGTIDVVQWVAS